MSTIFERICMATAVVAAAVVLVLSTVAAHDWGRFVPESTPREDVEAVQRGRAILERGRSPLVGIQPCDAIKSLLPERFTREDGDAKVKVWTGKDVIVCFRDSIDYGEAVVVAANHGLTWERGLGGDRILVFAPSEERFMQVARMNGLTFARGDVQNPRLLMSRLQGHDRVTRVGKQWAIRPLPGNDEVMFGPYTALGPGNYTVSVAFEPESAISCKEAMRIVHLSLSVSAAARVKELTPVRKVPLMPGVADDGHCLLSGEMTFSVTEPVDKVETPIWLNSPILPLRLVSYDILPAS
jgi:hypothetical protein